MSWCELFIETETQAFLPSFCISSHDNFLAAPDEYGRVVFVEYSAEYVETVEWLDLGKLSVWCGFGP